MLLGALWNGSKACHAFDIEARGAVCMQDDTCPDYMLKAEECLRQEEERVTNYLHVDSKQKLLVEVEREVLEQYETELLEKEHSGCSALLRDDKVRTVLPEILIGFVQLSALLEGLLFGMPTPYSWTSRSGAHVLCACESSTYAPNGVCSNSVIAISVRGPHW